VGDFGTGTLNISGGATVTANDTAYVASNPGASGTINFGAGGGTLTAYSLAAAPSQLTGTGTINTHGLVSDQNLTFDATHGLTQTLTFNSQPGQNITVNLSTASYGDLGAGYQTSGTLTIKDGVTVSSRSGYLGFLPGATGTAVVDGAGSKWANSADLNVGNYGTGALNISHGAKVTATGTTYVAKNSGATGSIAFGDGGGTLTTNTLIASPSQLTGTGTINTNGLVSDLDLVFDATHSSSQTLTLNSQPGQNVTVNLNAWSGYLGAGYQGSGTLTVQGGVTVGSIGGYIGYKPGSIGVATVNGGSWVNSTSVYLSSANLYVGNSGTGTLNVKGGGAVSDDFGYVAYSSGSVGTVTVDGSGSRWTGNTGLIVGSSGFGTLNVTGGGTVLSQSGSIGSSAGSTGVVTVDGNGSIWTNTSDLCVGCSGVATMNVTRGGAVTSCGYSGMASIGDAAGSVGTVTVDGNGSTWTDNSEVYVGNQGVGTMNVTGGGKVSFGEGASSGAYIAYAPGSTGVVKVDGNGSTWTNSGEIYVGSAGSGTLGVTNRGAVSATSTVVGNGVMNIASGGTVTNGSGTVMGTLAGPPSTVTVDGNGSHWTNSSLYVGEYGAGVVNVTHGGSVVSTSTYVGFQNGNGTLNIASGGTLSDTSGYITYQSNRSATGIVTVAGAGSLWSNSSSLTVGSMAYEGPGTGTLNIGGGGAVTAGSLTIYPNGLVGIDVGSSLAVGNSGSGLTNYYGTVRILAGAGATAGKGYSPISAATWTGSGAYQALGGTWNGSTHQFTASAIQPGAAGQQLTIYLDSEQRMLISDSATDWAVGASFLSSTTPKPLTVTATTIGGSTFASLQSMAGPQESILGGWQFAFTSGYTQGDPAYLSFDVGSGYSRDGLEVWHLDDGQWTLFTASDLTYDGTFASFTVTGFSGYAVTAPVPEPSTLVLLAAGAASLFAYAWRRRN
jgi:T5SS/PEP-CTERM-associated repeat protein